MFLLLKVNELTTPQFFICYFLLCFSMSCNGRLSDGLHIGGFMETFRVLFCVGAAAWLKTAVNGSAAGADIFHGFDTLSRSARTLITPEQAELALYATAFQVGIWLCTAVMAAVEHKFRGPWLARPTLFSKEKTEANKND